MKSLLVVLLCLGLMGCAMATASKVESAYTSGVFHEGMSFDEVVKVIGRNPSKNQDTYKVSNEKGIETIHWGVGSKLTTGWYDPFESYEFNFENKKLISWSKKNY